MDDLHGADEEPGLGEHRAPLPRTARKNLTEAKTHAPRLELVFPCARELQRQAMPLSELSRELGSPAVPHGVRNQVGRPTPVRTCSSADVSLRSSDWSIWRP